MSERRSKSAPPRRPAASSAPLPAFSPAALLCALAALFAAAAALPGLLDPAGWSTLITANPLLIDTDGAGQPTAAIAVDASSALLSAAATLLAAGVALDRIRGRG